MKWILLIIFFLISLPLKNSTKAPYLWKAGDCIIEHNNTRKSKNILFLLEVEEKTTYLSLIKDNSIWDQLTKISFPTYRLNKISIKKLKKWEKIKCPEEYNYHQIHHFLSKRPSNQLQKEKNIQNINKIFLQ